MDRNHHYPSHFQQERDEEQQRHASHGNQFHPGMHSSHHNQARFADHYRRQINNLDYSRDIMRHQEQYQYSHPYQNVPQMQQQRVAMQQRQDFPFQNEERSSRIMDDSDNMNMQQHHVNDFARNKTGRIREEPVFSFHRRGFAQDGYQNKQQRLFEQQNMQHRPQEDMLRQEQQLFQEDQEQQLLAREQQVRLRQQEQMEFRLGDIDFQGSNPNSPSRIQLQQQSVQGDGQYRLQPHRDVSFDRQSPEKWVNDQIGVQQRDNNVLNDDLGRQFQQRREEDFNNIFQNNHNGERNQHLANEMENRMRMQPNVFAQHRQYEQERFQQPDYRRESYRENHFPYHEDRHINAMNRQAFDQQQHHPQHHQQHNPWNQMIPRNEFRFNDANRNGQHVQDRHPQPHGQGLPNAMYVDENYRQRANHQNPYDNAAWNAVPYKTNPEGQNSIPEKVQVKHSENIVNVRRKVEVQTKRRKSQKNLHSSYKSNAYPRGSGPKKAPQLPSVEEIVSQFPNDASSIMFILDRRINMNKVSGYAMSNEETENELTVYELLRAWVRDDPYRERAKDRRGILDHIDLPYEKQMNDSDEKIKEKVDEILVEKETSDKSDVEKETSKVCDLFSLDEKDSKINSSDMDAVGKAFQESILKGKVKRRKRNRLLKKRDEVCLASLKRKHGIVIKS